MLNVLTDEIEQEIMWRQEEIARLEGLLEGLNSKSEYDFVRRPIVVMLYAHLEGFCHFILQIYVNHINSLGLSCSQVEHSIAALALAKEFKNFRNTEKKSDVFRNDLPDDKKLHNFAREKELLENFDEFTSKPVVISDKVIDFESNVKPSVLKKNLFQMSLPYENLEDYYDKINLLLQYRCNIAHGSFRSGISFIRYNELKESTYFIIEFLKTEIIEAIREEKYLKSIK